MTSTVAITPFLPDAAGVTDLEDWGLPDEATREPMQTRGVTPWEDGDSSAESGSARPGRRAGCSRRMRSSTWSPVG
jgi:hypothetical protein